MGIKDYLPSRANMEWAMTVPRSPKWVMRVGKPFQLIGGKNWTISFIRTGEIVPVEEFWEEKN